MSGVCLPVFEVFRRKDWALDHEQILGIVPFRRLGEIKRSSDDRAAIAQNR